MSTLDFTLPTDDAGDDISGDEIDAAWVQTLLDAIEEMTETVVNSTATGAQNNWSPGLVGHTTIFWSGASDITVTGFAGGVNGQRVRFYNLSSGGIGVIASFPYNSGASSAGNKLYNLVQSAATPVAFGGWIEYEYRTSQAAWVMIGHEQGAWITPTFNAGDWQASTGTWTVDSGDRLVDKYKLVGTTLHWSMTVVGTDVSATPTDIRRVFYGFTIRGRHDSLYIAVDAGGTPVVAQALADASSTVIQFSPTAGGGTWTATSGDNTTVYGQGMAEVQ